MRMKRILLASSALAVLAGAQQAQAASDLYVSVLGGANFVQEQSRSFDGGESSSSFAIDPDAGFVIGGVIGANLTNWTKGLRVELEAAYRRNDMGGAWTTDSGSTGGFLEGNLSTFSIMANAWYDIDVGHKIVPYVGGGFGWGRSHAEVARVETFTDSGTPGSTYDFRDSVDRQNSGFAWQLGLGFNYEVAPDVDVGLGYRYVVGPRFEEGGESGGLVTFDSDSEVDNENHAVQVNLTVGIN